MAGVNDKAGHDDSRLAELLRRARRERLVDTGAVDRRRGNVLGCERIGGQFRELGLRRQLRLRHHCPEPRIDVHLMFPFALCRALRHAPVYRLALTRRPRRQALAGIHPPVEDLHRRAPDATTGPHEFEGGE